LVRRERRNDTARTFDGDWIGGVACRLLRSSWPETRLSCGD
jgi:hypothetical protein